MNKTQREEYLGFRPKTIDKKVVYIGEYTPHYEKLPLHIFCKINYTDGKLSISGVVSPTKGGNARGSCGQMYDEIVENLDAIKYAEGWSKLKAFQFVETWKEWHLNDMKAGSPKQEEFVKEWKRNGNKYDYTAVCDALQRAGLLEDNGYTYGTKWLTVEVPTEVLQFLQSLPEPTRTPAWI